ncbi:PepSY-associated TM helix domain-containing protein [Myroides marinus]|uniref:PepSY-associated TM helix domain-containing protein n=1 Tax=Myroides marinus TaxID=703342 RepID=UPI002574D429|nr:PepSY-associated TM helix domain-containing protein [Myroides marinus]MDM1367193.1 PepSY domain-containing protein [Myroides marinus]
MQTDKPKKTKGVFKKYMLKTHLWLGLLSGIIVLIVSLSGAFFVFNEDISAYLRKDMMFHGETDIANKKPIPLKELKDLVNAQITNEEVTAEEVTIPLDPSRSYQFGLFKADADGWNYFDTYLIFKTVYVNQYTGKVIAVDDILESPFFFSMILHRSLLLKSSVGGTVVGVSTIIFVVMLVTGIILWWPKNKNMRKQRFWFRWKKVKGWRRKNYDVHNILGFYSSILALIVAVTGIMYSFRITMSWIYFLINGFSMHAPDYSHFKTIAPESMETPTTVDRIADKVREHYPNAFSFGIDLEDHENADHHHDNMTIRIKDHEFKYNDSHIMIFDEHSGELLFNRPHNERLLADRATGATYDLHVGAFFGMPGKIIAFILSLICASLPITGFIIYWGRRNKKKTTN